MFRENNIFERGGLVTAVEQAADGPRCSETAAATHSILWSAWKTLPSASGQRKRCTKAKIASGSWPAVARRCCGSPTPGVEISSSTGHSGSSASTSLCDTYLFKPIDAGELLRHLKSFQLVE